ncbi:MULTISPECIES: hypothetical protein [unclassified Frigoribacterium]|uniref:hypothetical protein n=1 Tax=unclassified Frigoribacterium TaxID=2627005 RepID=UPI001567319E|nr:MULTISPECIES: hypothetical protein [unclassified Frigoribacterium]NQW87329.1 hypothetical protein [Frigoribacterium sp. VKM Ac-2860]NQX09861.1 hypothetical protein [Frigoribacterium sp. VKM Ac-2859]
MNEADRELLRRAEAEVAALPHRDSLADSSAWSEGGPAAESEPTGRARLLAPLTLIVCFVTACAEGSWLWFSAAEWTSIVWFAVPFLLVASIVLAHRRRARRPHWPMGRRLWWHRDRAARVFRGVASPGAFHVGRCGLRRGRSAASR